MAKHKQTKQVVAPVEDAIVDDAVVDAAPAADEPEADAPANDIVAEARPLSESRPIFTTIVEDAPAAPVSVVSQRTLAEQEAGRARLALHSSIATEE